MRTIAEMEALLERKVMPRFDALDQKFSYLIPRIEGIETNLRQLYILVGEHNIRLNHLEQKLSAS